jgi:type III secretion protein U
MSSSEEKSEKPSDTKLKKQREKGSVPSTQDLVGLFSTAAGIAVLLGTAAATWRPLAESFAEFSRISQLPLENALNEAYQLFTSIFYRSVLPATGAVIGVAIIVNLIVNKGVVFSLEPVIPKPEKVSPVSGFKRIFGKRGWIEMLTATIRVLLWGGISYVIFLRWRDPLLNSIHCEEPCLGAIPAIIFTEATLGALILFVVLAASDIIIQKALFISEQKMSKTEVKQEQKDQQGSNEIKSERRRLAQEAQHGPSKSGPKVATLCFYTEDAAIGILYHPPDYELPYVVAKAKGPEKVAALRKIVRDKGMWESQDPVLVKVGLKASIGGVLDPDHFGDFARALSKMFP